MKMNKVLPGILLALALLPVAIVPAIAQEDRCGLVTLKSTPLTLVGPELKAGNAAPSFTALDYRCNETSLEDFAGKVKIISVLPSVDTPT